MHKRPASCSTRYLTISKWPSKQAARRGVELVLVVQLTEAPRRTRKRTMVAWPAAAATHNGGASSIVSPSNVTAMQQSTHVIESTQPGFCLKLVKSLHKVFNNLWWSLINESNFEYLIHTVRCRRRIVRRGTRRRPSARCDRPWALALPRWSSSTPAVPLHLSIGDLRKPKRNNNGNKTGVSEKYPNLN